MVCIHSEFKVTVNNKEYVWGKYRDTTTQNFNKSANTISGGIMPEKEYYDNVILPLFTENGKWKTNSNGTKSLYLRGTNMRLYIKHKGVNDFNYNEDYVVHKLIIKWIEDEIVKYIKKMEFERGQTVLMVGSE